MVVDNYDRICLVIDEREVPSQDWLDAQDDKSVKTAIDCKWYKMYPDTGGAVIAPATHIRRLGHKARGAELMKAYENSNWSGKRNIMEKLVEAAF